MPPLMPQLDAACEAAREAGRVLLTYIGKVSVREKGRSDLVTDADIAAQQTIQRILTGRFPHYGFLGEESSPEEQAAARLGGKPIWVVDPLDGTTNFVHRMPGFSVSIALVLENQVQLGVVYDPIQNVVYTAVGDGPALRDGKPITASRCENLEQALVCFSLQPGVRRNDPSIQQFLDVLERCQSIRRLGSAALNLCYLAEGFLDSYWATSVKCWDVAAGYLIARQAGAVFSHCDGSPLDLWNPVFVGSATTPLHRQMIGCLNRAGAHASEAAN
jgi:myo-inositol-1(or 4)-monophosphatase